jgi:hypothetical protein
MWDDAARGVCSIVTASLMASRSRWIASKP